MKDRIIAFLKSENKSSAQFAEEIGVQPSGISHILSGRNNPSLDFIIKMLEKYKFLSTDWLLFGKGTMYRDNSMPTLFDNPVQTLFDKTESDFSNNQSNNISENTNTQTKSESEKEGLTIMPDLRKGEIASVRKIVWFFDNNEFEEYYPVKP